MTDNHFRRLWDLGYRRLAPITPPGCGVSTKSSFHRRIQAGDDARGKAPGVRWPDGTWSGFDFVAHESTEADLDKWHAMGAGVGVKTGRGLVFVDCDTSQIEHARIVKDIAERIFGPLIPRIGRDPKFGFLLRTAADFQYCRVEFGERDAKGRLRDRVEILSEGRQFVAQGTHPGTGKPYRWPKGTPAAADVMYADPATILEFLSAVAAALPAASVPAGLSASGLPVGLQVVGPRFSEPGSTSSRGSQVRSPRRISRPSSAWTQIFRTGRPVNRSTSTTDAGP